MGRHFNFHKNNFSFERHKWAKRHEHLVENCLELNIGQLVGLIPFDYAQNFIPWSPPTHPHLKIVPARAGFSTRWWLQCPSCGGHYGTLYALPEGDLGDWKCRKCHGLIYASQRHGPRHPLRKVLTPLKRSRRRKEAIRQQRIFPQQETKQRKLLQHQEEPIVDQNFIHMMKEMKKFINSGGSIIIRTDAKRIARS